MSAISFEMQVMILGWLVLPQAHYRAFMVYILDLNSSILADIPSCEITIDIRFITPNSA
jgi:hypothetical protein